ncbi:helix-turn-helix transcriptional regulator [Nocardioides sp.]|uniref:helix-turn-helix transcriptional regulator n=1 Tax=Nocardioides sp. TaxID=35761 RepID=UPI00271ACDD6|nr:helix-turn-helix transcriptional regulator [Nocardioides sp.]MDO9455962.1 helix-turn-helix transcriptional regulator [Nocardioides sp.]
MPTRRNATSTRAGILRPEEFAQHVSMKRTETATGLAPWVEYHWTLAWDLPAGTTYPSAVIPHPAANLSVEHGAGRAEADGEVVLVTGVTTRRFEVAIRGSGWVHGVKLRPGGLVALTGTDAKALTDRTVPAKDVLPVAVHDALDGLRPGTPAPEATEVACAALATLVPTGPDPAYDELLGLVEDMLADRTLLRVDEVAERHGLSKRALERLFARYVGVGPKWVLARYRMHDVVTALDGGYDGSLADLAADYGWFDQAHFGRDFTALVGVTPSDYRTRAQ